MSRSILHCDMNNFYASVECMLDPSLKKYPVAVCGSVEERHGIVLAKNYAAKAFGVATGDAVSQAKQKCKDLVTDVYSHIIDEDRRLNAQRFEETFYQKKKPSEVNGDTAELKKEPQGITEEAMLNYMVQNPEFLQKFKVLLGVGN